MNTWERLNEQVGKMRELNPLADLFLTVNGERIVRGFLMPALAEDENVGNGIATDALQRLCTDLVKYGFFDRVLQFALFLRCADTSGEALAKFYEIIDRNKPFLGKSPSEWCEAYLSLMLDTFRKNESMPNASWEDFDRNDVEDRTADFIVYGMLGVKGDDSVEQAIRRVTQVIAEDATLRIGDRALSETGWLQHVYRQHAFMKWKYDSDNVVYAMTLLKRALERLSEVEDLQPYVVALLDVYVDWAVSAHTNDENVNPALYEVKGVGKAIGEFAQKRRDLVEDLGSRVMGLWRNLLYFAVCQAVHETDYATAAVLLVRHYENARVAKQQQMREKLYNTYMEIPDEVMALSLFCVIQWDQRRSEQQFSGLKNAFTAAQMANIQERFGEVVNQFVKNSQENLQLIKNNTELTEELRMVAAQEESDRYRLVTSLFPSAAHFQEKINDSIDEFKRTNGNLTKDLFACLGEEEKETVVAYLREGELIYSLFKMLQEDRGGEELYDGLDFSPAILQLTKAMEYIGNLIWQNIDVTVRQAVINNRVRGYRHLTKQGVLKLQIEFGNFQHLFKQPMCAALSRSQGTNSSDTRVYLSDLLDISQYPRNGQDIFNNLGDLVELRNNAAHPANGRKQLISDYRLCEGKMMTDYQSRQFELWQILNMVKEGVTLREQP